MIAICAWCGKHIREVEPLEDRHITHGICITCRVKFEREEKLISRSGDVKLIDAKYSESSVARA